MQSVSGGVVTPSAIVAGAGSAAANGTYTERGTFMGKPYYNLVGEADDTGQLCIRWNDEWEILGAGTYDTNMFYYSAPNVAFPWDVVTWTEYNGSLPVPTVTEG